MLQGFCDWEPLSDGAKALKRENTKKMGIHRECQRWFTPLFRVPPFQQLHLRLVAAIIDGSSGERLHNESCATVSTVQVYTALVLPEPTWCWICAVCRWCSACEVWAGQNWEAASSFKCPPFDTCASTQHHFSSDRNLTYMIKDCSLPLLLFGQQSVPVVTLVELDLD